jgi:hypothetical protein
MSSSQSLDHLILFVPVNPETNLPKLPPFFERNFTLTPGGFHADGATSNTLILLADGCYIELISFIDPSKASDHWWGPDSGFTGWKDWCLTNSKSPEENNAGIKDTHSQPIHGGRKRADGVEVKWAVTFPKGEKGGQGVRGSMPFFCHDITQRNIRVPLSAEKTEHPCGALGVRELTIIFNSQALLDATKVAYASILGDTVSADDAGIRFQAGKVCEVDGLDSGASIVLRQPKDAKEAQATKKTGFRFGDVILSAKSNGEDKVRGLRVRIDKGEDDLGGLWVEYI